MLKFFSKGFFTQYAMAFLIGLLFWLPAFLGKPVIVESNLYMGPLSGYFNQMFSYMGVAGTFVAYLIIFGAALIVNQLSGYYSVAAKTGALPLFLFVIISSYIPALTTLSVFTIIVLWMILLIVVLFKHSDKSDNIMQSLDAGIITGILILFYFPLIWLMLLIWIAFITFRNVSWRNFAVSILGMVLPAFFVYAILLFSGNETLFFNKLYLLFNGGLNPELTPLKPSAFVAITVPVIILFSAVKVMFLQTNLTISQRNYLFLLGVYAIIIFVINLFYSVGYRSVLLLAPAGSVTLNNLIVSSKKQKWTNIIIIVLLLLFLFNTWFTYFHAAQ